MGSEPLKSSGWRSAPGSRWAVAAAIALVVGPLLWVGVPREVARWYLAAAMEAARRDDTPTTLRHLDLALQWNPQLPEAYTQRALERLRAGDLPGAWEDSTRAADLEGTLGVSGLSTRSLVHQRKGDHDAALADIEAVVSILSDYPDQFPVALNQRAYARALAGRDLELGSQDIQKAIELTAADQPKAPLSVKAAFLDTRGFLHHLAGRHAEAINDLDQAVDAEEKRWAAAQQELAKSPSGLAPREEREHRETLAVIRHHRGLAYQAAGRTEEAAAELEGARQLGYDPSKGVW